MEGNILYSKHKKLTVPAAYLRRGLLNLGLITVALVWVYPFIWMITAAFKTDNEFFKNRLSLWLQSPTLDNIKRVWFMGHFGQYFFNTVYVTVLTVLIVLITTSLLGYVMGRYDFTGKKVIMATLLASIAVPLVSTVIPIYNVVKAMGLLNTKTGLILATAGSGHVVFILLFSGAFKSIPNEMEESALLDGCGFFRLFVSIMAPLVKPIATTVVIMQTIWTWNAFLLPLVLTLNKPSARTLAVGLYAFRGENTVDWTGIAAGATISVIPVLVLFLFLQKYFVNGIAGAIKS